MEKLIENITTDKTDGNGRHKADYSKPPALYQPSKLGKKINVIEQPVPSPGPMTADEIGEMLGKLEGLLPEAKLSFWEFIFLYRTRAAQATEAYKYAERESLKKIDEQNIEIEARKTELDKEITEQKKERKEIDGQHLKANYEYSKAISTSGLKGTNETPSPEEIENLLDETAPEPEEIHGKHGSGRQTNRTMGEQVLTTFYETFAPLLAGFVLAVTFGTLAGFVTLNDIVKGDHRGILIGCCLLGFIIVYAVGHLAQYTVETTADSLETNQQHSRPRHRRGIVFTVFLSLVLLFITTCEIKIEAEGLRSLHEQRNNEMLRLNPEAEVGLLSGWAYLLMGTIASGSYIAYKLSRSWRMCQHALQDNWQANERRTWIESKRSEPSVRLAFVLAGTIKMLQDRIGVLDESIAGLEKRLEELRPLTEPDEKTQERLDYLYAAAAAEAARLIDYIHKLIEKHEPSLKA